MDTQFCIPVFVLHALALRYGTFCVGVVRAAGAEGEDGVVVVILEGHEVRLVVVVVVVVEIVRARVGVAQLRGEK